MSTLPNLKKDLRSYASPERAKALQRFFKTGPGQYGEGDVFLGMTVPDTRAVARKHKSLSFADTKKLLLSPIHEERLAALLLLVHRFETVQEKEKKNIFDFYIAHTKLVNNWDLVDLSAGKIVGAYLFERPKTILARLAKSRNIWERRIAIIATSHFINNSEFAETIKISQILIADEHDLIHKAVGWMLREVGKRSLVTEETFLKKHYKQMPRTMLRYAIERFPEKKRQAYLRGRA